MPRVLEANRHEKFDREIMNEMGALGLPGLDPAREVRLRRRQLHDLRLVAREVERSTRATARR
jgi:glutaryl-CoA dehydrogenase